MPEASWWNWEQFDLCWFLADALNTVLSKSQRKESQSESGWFLKKRNIQRTRNEEIAGEIGGRRRRRDEGNKAEMGVNN